MRNKRRVHRVGWRLIAVSLAWLLVAGGAAAQDPAPPHPDLPARASDPAHLRGGWYPWDPYQYRDYRRGIPILTGFDVEIERALARIMSVEILLPEIAWEDHLAVLSAGTADIAAGAMASEARSRFIFLKTVSNRDGCSDPAKRGERPIPFPYDRADSRHLWKAEVSPRGRCRVHVCR